MFDLFDTLVYFRQEDYMDKVHKAASLCGIDEHRYLNAWTSSGADSILGRHPATADRVDCFLQTLGIQGSHELVELLTDLEHEFLRDKTYWYDDAIATLTELRRMGIKLGLVTNASPSVLEVIRSKHIYEFIDKLIVSSAVMMAKPDTGIYLECLSRLGCRSAGTAYVGDGNDRELEGAKQAGLFTILVKRNTPRTVVREQSGVESTDVVIEQLSSLPSILGTGQVS